MTSASALLTSACLLVALFMWFRKPKTSSASLPPGPKPIPILGNVLDLTSKELWLPASEWAKQYGDVVYLHLLGFGLVFLNSPEAAFDLLDNRGSIYSDKPALVMVGELCGCKNMVAFTPYGEQFKNQRKLMHKAFGVSAVPSYHPLIQTETHSFLQRLIVDPAEYITHVKRYAGGLTLSVVYGYETVSNEDEFLRLAEECVDLLANRIASGGGIWPVDIFPILKHMPLWMPGSGFKKNAIEWKKKMEEFVDRPYEFVKNSLKMGTYKSSFCSNLLLEETSIQEADTFEFDLKWSANSMYAASVDTTITTVSQFILAMMLYPEAQKRAHQELDAVVGTDCLPTFTDRSSLPFVECIFMETLRWGVPVPLNLPHRLMEDNIYKGMHIPKGSLVFGNIWAMLRNENLYPDPEAFRPERYLESVTPEMERKRNPKKYVFGFGRRQCPGENLVDSSIWLLLASMLATLDISKAVDEHGNAIEPVVEFDNSIFRIPNQFKCDIRPRSPKALSLIKQSKIPVV